MWQWQTWMDETEWSKYSGFESNLDDFVLSKKNEVVFYFPPGVYSHKWTFATLLDW